MSDADVAARHRADMVRALTEEREAFLRRGLKDRAAAVDAELARFGAAPVKRTAPKRATAKE